MSMNEREKSTPQCVSAVRLVCALACCTVGLCHAYLLPLKAGTSSIVELAPSSGCTLLQRCANRLTDAAQRSTRQHASHTEKRRHLSLLVTRWRDWRVGVCGSHNLSYTVRIQKRTPPLATEVTLDARLAETDAPRSDAPSWLEHWTTVCGLAPTAEAAAAIAGTRHKSR